MVKKIALVVWILLLYGVTKAQSINWPELPAEVQNKSICIQFDNDTYYLTDYYYTNGLAVDLTLPVFSQWPVAERIKQKYNYQALSAGLSLSHHLYTPKNIRDTLVQFNDRPFASTLEIDYFLKNTPTEAQILWEVRIQLGIIGPAAGGEAFQRKIHEWIDSPDPLGWEYEIANDLLLNINITAGYPLYSQKNIKIMALIAIRVGTLFDDINAGLGLQLGNGEKYQQRSSRKKPRPYLNANATVKGVAYNATMQGGFLSPYNTHVINAKNIERVVFSANTTFGVLWQGVSIDYTHNFLTKEFKAGSSHQYGSFKLTIFF